MIEVRPQCIEVRGTSVPVLGFGTWRLHGAFATEAIADALAIGYRHIDTAHSYENEIAVGRAVKESGVPRDAIFLTSKFMASKRLESRFGSDSVKWSAYESLEWLQTDYLDLLLLHWPSPDVALSPVLSALHDLKDEGVVREIGVSNFPPSMLLEALELAPIFCNQVEYHPFLSQDAVLAIATEHDLLVAAHTPLASGRALHDPVLRRIGHKYGKTAAQVAVRWLLDQQNVCAIPMAESHALRLENWNIFDFSLSSIDSAQIAQLPKHLRTVDPSWAPEWED